MDAVANTSAEAPALVDAVNFGGRVMHGCTSPICGKPETAGLVKRAIASPAYPALQHKKVRGAQANPAVRHAARSSAGG